MSDSGTGADNTQALSTKLEEEFISPLTAVRGILEILRDFPHLSSIDQQQFIHNALKECTRLESGVEHLATAVYAAGERARLESANTMVKSSPEKYAARIHVLKELSIIDVDFGGFEFNCSKLVNEFYDELENVIRKSGKKWYFIVNYSNIRVWPEAWVAFAHRGKKVKVGYSLGTVRYTQKNPGQDNDNIQHQNRTGESDMFDSRDLAIDHINSIRLDAN